VIEAVDGPIYLNTCVTSGKTCPRQSWCPAHPVWVDAQQALLKVLDDARIQDLANGSSMLGSGSPFGVLQCAAQAAAAVQPNGCACEMSAVGHS
jgi:DNA-binding IscR family transcriptional regulator